MSIIISGSFARRYARPISKSVISHCSSAVAPAATGVADIVAPAALVFGVIVFAPATGTVDIVVVVALFVIAFLLFSPATQVFDNFVVFLKLL